MRDTLEVRLEIEVGAILPIVTRHTIGLARVANEFRSVRHSLVTRGDVFRGGAMAILAVVEKNSFKITSGEDKIHNLDTKPTCHRKFCKDWKNLV